MEYKNILSTDIFFNFDEGFSVRKRTDFAVSERDPYIFGNLIRQREIGRTAENFHNILIARMFVSPTQTGKSARRDVAGVWSICGKSIKIDFENYPK